MQLLVAVNPPAVLAFGMPGGSEWIILLVLGLLIFGRRLPEVGRSLGKGIVEFKKGIKGIEDEIEAESDSPRLASKSASSQIGQSQAGAESAPMASERTDSAGPQG